MPYRLSGPFDRADFMKNNDLNAFNKQHRVETACETYACSFCDVWHKRKFRWSSARPALPPTTAIAHLTKLSTPVAYFGYVKLLSR